MKVLFICKGNLGRSQVAEGFFNHLSKKHSAFSAGTRAEKYKGRKLGECTTEVIGVGPEAVDGNTVVENMKDHGVDLSENTPMQLTPEMTDEADLIVSMEEDLPEYVDESKTRFWEVENPKGKDVEGYLAIQEQVRLLVKELLEEIE